ncbi:MAG: orotidine-5'-phosphate decarboxylase [Hyphomicrobiales bacterium]|nr:orotidine-5'-phosphate decarboxylase [Hyphomicrobiales bacterium]
MQPALSPRDRLIVGLDLADADSALAMVARLGDSVSFYKIGMELIYGSGFDVVRRLVDDGKQVFVDLKLHDIPHTVERATAQIAKLGATFLTVHGFVPTMQGALTGAAGSSLRLLAVTVLTSFDEEDVRLAGYRLGLADLVALRAEQAQRLGVSGLVMSAHEAAAMRARLGPAMVLVTPGIRPSSGVIGDQKRVMTPGAAIKAGADHLVVARPILTAADPRAMANSIIDEIAAAL